MRPTNQGRAVIVIWLALILGLGGLPVLAQQAVVTSPSQAGSANVSSTVTSTSVFQLIIDRPASGRPRQGCLIQNNGSNNEYVFFGPTASATTSNSFVLVPPSTGVQGGSISCASFAGGVLQDQVSVSGTSGDAFVAAYQ